MIEWVEIDGLAFRTDPSGRNRRWVEYCPHCRRKTQIRIEEGTCGPGSMPFVTSGTAALSLEVQESPLDNRVHYARCSVCDRRSPLPLELR